LVASAKILKNYQSPHHPAITSLDLIEKTKSVLLTRFIQAYLKGFLKSLVHQLFIRNNFKLIYTVNKHEQYMSNGTEEYHE